MKATEAYSEAKQAQRQAYWEVIRDIDPANLVFLDETGVNVAMSTLYARAIRGQRAYGKQPKAVGKNITLLGAMTLAAGFLEGLSFEGGLTGDVFVWFIETVLCPQLWSGAVVVMDNVAAHKVSGVRAALEAVGARVVYLSPYSPDFNPIENLWSKLKGYLRSAEARTKETLHQSIADGLKSISRHDVRQWFAHCCYCSEPPEIVSSTYDRA